MIRFVALSAMLGLAACAPADRAFSWVVDSTGDLGGRIGMPWGHERPQVIATGLTVDRVRRGGGVTAAEPLREEEGNVWPAAEGPRATLANPDEALRGIPAFRPENPPTPRRGSGAALDAPAAPVAARATPAAPATVSMAPEQRRTVTTPAGTFNLIDNPRAGAAIGPSGNIAAVTGDRAVTIISEPGRPAQQVLNPPR